MSDPDDQRHGPIPDFRATTTLGVALAGIVLLLPFSLNNLIQERFSLGIGSIAVVAVLGWTAISIHRGRYRTLPSVLGIAVPVLGFLVLSIREQGMIGVLWCFPAILAFYITLPERFAWGANLALLLGPLPMAWAVLDSGLAPRVGATLLAVSLFSALFVRVISVQQQRLREQAVTDPLTGLSNRMLLETALARAIEQNRRTDAPMSLVALDLDHFKRINDAHGHDAGDRVLAAVGAWLGQRVRRVDQAFRLGGEEFLLLLFATSGDQAAELAEEVRRAVARLDALPEQAVTLSAGVAELEPGEDWRSWMKRGDDALYRAKDRGRDRVEL